MTPEILPKQRLTFVGMDFFGNPYEKAVGWSEQNGIGQLWQRFEAYYQAHQADVKQRVSESGYELWLGGEAKGERKTEHIFVGVQVSEIEDLPLPLLAKPLPETRYARFVLKGPEIQSNWHELVWREWLPAAGLELSHSYLIECYDAERFQGMGNPDSELDIYVPIV